MMADEDIITQEYSYPDNNYEGNLGVDDKTPATKWAYPNRAAVPELFNWVGRKSYEDIERIANWLTRYGATQRLEPITGLFPISGEEPPQVLVDNYLVAFDMVDNYDTEVRGNANIIRTEPALVLHWSMPDVDTSDDPKLYVDVDITGNQEAVGTSITSTSATLSVPNNSDRRQETVINLGDVSEGDSDSDDWDDVLGKTMSFFVRREPDTDTNGSLHLHD